MNILLLNAGSSSLKGTLMESADGKGSAHVLADWAGSVTHYRYVGPDGREHGEEVSCRGHAEAVRRFLHDLMHTRPIAMRDAASLAGVGHRIVHGGPFTSSARITPEVRSRVAALSKLAPLHNPPSLAALAAAEAELAGVPQVAVFDTAFHATLPPEARTYPIPAKWTREWGIRRFGFHGLSHAYCARRAAEMLERPLEDLRLVICHLVLPEYNVSLAERLIPASDVSNQISTAGYEASGTSNMKFMMNGALTIGTRDGATIEMAEEAGKENFFLFGLTAERVAHSRGWYDPRWHSEHDPEIRAALDAVFADHFSLGEPGIFAPLRDTLLTGGDHYLHLADLHSYLEADQRLIDLYSDRDTWARKAILNIAASGKFSSDRSIAEYAASIWNAEPCPVV